MKRSVILARVMIRATFLFILLAIGLAPLPATAARTLAVLPLKPGAGGPAYAGLGTALAGMLITDLSTASNLQLVERQQLTALLTELKLARTPFIDPKTAQTLGHGVGAELVVVGSYSVVQETFLMDARIIGVKSGAIIHAAQARGPMKDFVAVEKGVVEDLLKGLKVSLSLAERRRLLTAAPTEDARALAQYGRGLEAKDGGDLPTAKQAFEAALAQDPRFAQAATALATLNAQIKRLQRQSQTRAQDARTRSLERALARLVDATTRPPDFIYDWQAIRDLSLRQALLRIHRQPCPRYRELAAFLRHTRGQWTPWYRRFPGDRHYDRWRAAERHLDAHGKTLGLVGPGTYFGARPGELMQLAGAEMRSAVDVLLSHNLQPEKFSGTLIHSLQRCFPPAAQIAEWDKWEAFIRAEKLDTQPLWTVQGQGPATVTVEDGALLYGAYLRAKHRGITPEVNARTAAVLARHPEADPDRRNLLSRIRGIVQAAQRRERRLAQRFGQSSVTVVTWTEAVMNLDAALINLKAPLCRALGQRLQARAAEAHAKWTALNPTADARTRDRVLERMADRIAPLVLSGCLQTPKAPSDMTAAAIMSRVRAAADRRHPDRLKDPDCQTRIAQLIAASDPDTMAPPRRQDPTRAVAPVQAAVNQLYRLQTQRCLVP